jgi:hypothetical protein
MRDGHPRRLVSSAIMCPPLNTLRWLVIRRYS